MKIVLFSLVIDKVSNNTCHDFIKMRIQRFMDLCVLKSTEITTLSENESVKISVRDMNFVFPYVKKI